jgi:hypothetical protein
VPNDAQAELTNLSQGLADAATAEAGEAIELSVAARSGDRLVLAVEGRGVALAAPLRLVFSEPVAGFASAKPIGTSVTAGAHAPTDEWRKVDATTWEFLPVDGWHADTGYLLTLPESVSDLESPPRQLGTSCGCARPSACTPRPRCRPARCASAHAPETYCCSPRPIRGSCRGTSPTWRARRASPLTR